MIRKAQGPVGRWLHEAPGGDVDAELGDVFRAAAHEEPMTDVELSRVGRRLARGAVRRSRPMFRLLPVTLAVLTGGTGAALAEWMRPGIWDHRAPVPASSQMAPTPRSRPASPEPKAAPPPLPEVVAAPVELAGAPVDPVPVRVPASEAAAGPSGITLESELLQKALERLRREHDGAGALRLLDEHRARFPSGVLALEAAVARIDALLLLGRRAEALTHLQRLPLARVGRRSELQLLRAELQAERDCGKALADFDAVLVSTAPAGLAERALFGRATCRLRSGDETGGRADLQSYLARFPSGRFAAQVRDRLAR